MKISKVVRKVLLEMDEPRDDSFSVEPNVKMIPREKQIQNMFGKYDERKDPINV